MGIMSSRRQSSLKAVTKAFSKELLKNIDEVDRLRKEGKKEEADLLLDKMKNDLINKLNELEKKTNSVQELDRSVLPANGDIFAESDRIVLRMVSETEKSFYDQLFDECNEERKEYSDDLKDSVWKSYFADKSCVCTIYEKGSGEYIGYCSVKDMTEATWELAIEELIDKRGQGYGYEALKLFTINVHKLTGQRFFDAKIDIDNYASQAIVKKLGAYPDGTKEYLLTGESLELFRNENMDLIDNKTREIAEEFCVDPEDLLGMVLQYRLDMNAIDTDD